MLALCSVLSAHAAEVPVFNTNDAFAGSLRQAIQDAAAGDTIVFQIPTSSPGYNGATRAYTIGLTSGELLITKNLTITGGGQRIIVQRASGTFRIFRIGGGSVVTIDGLTIANGFTSDAGGIFNAGNLTLRNCTVSGNRAGVSHGGGMTSSGNLQISNCTFSGNNNVGAEPGSQGSAILAFGNLTIDNSTISGNTSAPSAVYYGGGGTARVRNSIIAGNIFGDVTGTFVSEGYNLIGVQTAGTSGFGATGDQLGVSAAQAGLGPLQDNGGPTMTMRPLPGSLAIDQGKRGLNANNQPIDVDQRGYPRPIDLPGTPNAFGGDGSDIGAVETGPTQSGPTFTVTNTDSHNDGSCTTDDCTLVEALNASNANADANTIVFAPGIGGVITTSSPYPVSNPVHIQGPGARVLKMTSVNFGNRFFNVTAQNAVIEGLTFERGHAFSANGGAIFNSGGLTVQDCTFFGNAASGRDSVGLGGGIYNAAVANLILSRCTFQDNFSVEMFGGGVYSEGTLSATNCTFTGNSAVRGGGLILRGSAQIALRNCTFANNTATDGVASPGFGGGGLFCEGAAANHFLGNNLIAGNFATNNPDIRGQYTSQGHNLIGKIGDATGITNGAKGDIVGTTISPINAQFYAFGNHGGPTDTWSLRQNSPARDAGSNSVAIPTDQRGYPRVGVADIGAFEYASTFDGLRITSASRVGNDFLIRFSEAVAGTTYRLERNTNLFQPLMWQPAMADFTATTNGSAAITTLNPFTLAPVQFYRITVP